MSQLPLVLAGLVVLYFDINSHCANGLCFLYLNRVDGVTLAFKISRFIHVKPDSGKI